MFGADNAFGSTEALRIDSGSSVDLNGHAQTAGALFALGANALKGSGQLTVAGDALLQGANEALSADLAFNGDVTIEDEAALGTGNVALGAGVDLTITGTEASGSLVNAITGNESTSINVASGADITFESLKLGDAGYTGALNLTGSSAAALDTEGAIANAVSVEKGSRLSLAAASKATRSRSKMLKSAARLRLPISASTFPKNSRSSRRDRNSRPARARLCPSAIRCPAPFRI